HDNRPLGPLSRLPERKTVLLQLPKRLRDLIKHPVHFFSTDGPIVGVRLQLLIVGRPPLWVGHLSVGLHIVLDGVAVPNVCKGRVVNACHSGLSPLKLIWSRLGSSPSCTLYRMRTPPGRGNTSSLRMSCMSSYLGGSRKYTVIVMS